MPYFEELSVAKPRTVSTKHVYLPSGAVSPWFTGVDFDEWTRLRTFRSGPAKGNVRNSELTEASFDKYAYFLNSTRDRKFLEALKARGMDLSEMPPDRGHPFFMERVRHLWRGAGTVSNNSYRADVDGWVYPSSNAVSMDALVPTSTVETFAYQSWGRVAPKSEVFDAGVFFGELREGLPSIIPSLLKGKTAFFKDIGSDYLNIEFGWKPFINDLQNAAQALLSAQTSLSRPYGPVHRYREIEFNPSATEVSVFTGSTVYRNMLNVNQKLLQAIEPRWGMPGGYATISGTATSSALIETRSWFEGNFFLLPKIGYDPSSYLSKLDALVNTKITPRVLWELAPWSWLVDWGLRIGDALQTAESLADDRVHAQYAYGMQHTKVHRTSMLLGTLTAGSIYERKERVRANPYGFQVGGFAGLSTWQQSILLALGLTKVRR